MNCVTPIPTTRPVGISERISFVSVVEAVSLFGGVFVVWCWFFLVFVLSVAVVSLLGFFVFLNCP